MTIPLDEPSEDESPKVSEANARLGDSLLSAKDARSEERFIWIIIVVILVDVIWFKDSPNPAAPFVVLVLQLILLMVIGKVMGIDDIVDLIDRFLHTVSKNGSTK